MAPALKKAMLQYTKSSADANDLVQEVGVRVFTHKSELRNPLAARAFIFVTAKNVGVDWCRARKRRVPIVVMDDDCFPSDTNPSTQVYYSQSLQAVLDALTPRQREALILRHHLGLSHDEIADRLHCSVATVRFHLDAARDRLAASFPEGYPHDTY
jgi:RNA polymerase sigma-70 factor (ECF subfamily)